MQKKVTIQVKKNKKALYPAFYLLYAVTIVILLITVVLLVKDNNRIRECIANEFISKGKSLVNFSIVSFGEMATESAVKALQEKAENIVQSDYDITYLIYMDTNCLPVVIVSRQKSDENIVKNVPLNDSVSIWVSKLSSIDSKRHTNGGEEIIEFAGPVINNKEKSGFIRYGISTRTMHKTIHELMKSRIVQTILTMLIFLFAGLAILLFFRSKVKKHTSCMAEQVQKLAMAAEIIAKGNFNEEIKAEDDNDIGNLAVNMDKMRSAIKYYIDHLQKAIDAKGQQINDILNNIDQGLFTIDFDGRVNQEYSKRANEILKVEDISKHSIQELFRSDQKQEQAFATWLGLVKANYNRQRWNKLVRLCPVHEIELHEFGSSSKSHISFEYKKVLDNENNLSKILILARDITDERRRESEVQEQKRKLDNEVKNILAIVNNQPEKLNAFTAEVQEKLTRIKDAMQTLLDGVERMRAEYPGGKPFVISDEQIQKLYMEINTINIKAESLGFESITTIISEFVMKLEELHPPVETRRDATIKSLIGVIDQLFDILNGIRKKVSLCYGEDKLHLTKNPQ